MTFYLLVKVIHVSTAIISILGFFVRGVWMMRSSPMLNVRWVKIAPHINDTLLLISAIVLVIITSQYPGPVAWINVKIIGVIIYIILGTIALKYGKTKRVRIIAWCLALLIYSYIVLVAISKNSLLIFSLSNV